MLRLGLSAAASDAQDRETVFQMSVVVLLNSVQGRPALSIAAGCSNYLDQRAALVQYDKVVMPASAAHCAEGFWLDSHGCSVRQQRSAPAALTAPPAPTAALRGTSVRVNAE
jgi:hypothetical protein